MQEQLYKELNALGLSESSSIKIHEIRNKDGVYLYKIEYMGANYVLKYFEKDEYKREIVNYALLKQLGVPTIKHLGSTENSILLEDLESSSCFRLGIEEDMSDVEVARKLALWYKQLHSKGATYLAKGNLDYYRETDEITKDNIELIKNSSSTRDNKVWELIEKNWDLLLEKISQLEETITYNDFYYTNLAVSHDKMEAVMFDYNLLGVGYRYGDIRNVCSSLSEKAKAAFLDEYGNYDEREKIIDEGVAHLINLSFAYKRPKFPSWGQESLEAIQNGELEQRIIKILQLA